METVTESVDLPWPLAADDTVVIGGCSEAAECVSLHLHAITPQIAFSLEAGK